MFNEAAAESFKNKLYSHKAAPSSRPLVSHTNLYADRKRTMKISSNASSIWDFNLNLETFSPLGNASRDLIIIQERLIVEKIRPIVQNFLKAVIQEVDH